MKRQQDFASIAPLSPTLGGRHILSLLTGLALLLVFLMGCGGDAPGVVEAEPLQVTLAVDGELYNLTTEATNVRELLEEAGVATEPTDQVTPALFTPLEDGLHVSVVRVRETIETIEEELPFERTIVRSEAMSADEPPRIIQGGRTGKEEITVRVIYHDGVEVDRQRTKVTVIEEPQDEIVMVGVGATPGTVNFAGTIAYISGGNSIILRGSTAFPAQLHTGNGLDGRVFSLSPTGSHLLYTRVLSDTGSFNNSLWLISTEPGEEPRSLGIQNVLWADWNPSRTASLQIAYSTGNAVGQPPGWEANNDLWIATVFASEDFPVRSERIVETYPATYGWWGGNYEWSPTGRYLAFSYADEVGVIDLEAAPGDLRIPLDDFTEYNTRADWVWLPTLTWSPDGNYLAYTVHGGTDEAAMAFDLRVADVGEGVTRRFASQTGMWSHPHWSPPNDSPPPAAAPSHQIAYLQASNPLDGLRSPYSLWLVDQDGSNERQVYPPVGENSRFSLERQFMAWGPTGRDVAFIFDDALFLYNLDLETAIRVTEDDAVASRPTWAPYGAGITGNLPKTDLIPFGGPPIFEPDLPSEGGPGSDVAGPGEGE